MRKSIFAIVAVSLCMSCDQSRKKVAPTEQAWVYVEIFYVINKDTTINYLYGKLSAKDLKKFEKNSQDPSLFKLTDSRYIDTNDKVRAYGKHNSDNNDVGTFHYRFKDVVRLEVQKTDPLEYYKSNENE